MYRGINLMSTPCFQATLCLCFFTVLLCTLQLSCLAAESGNKCGPRYGNDECTKWSSPLLWLTDGPMVVNDKHCAHCAALALAVVSAANHAHYAVSAEHQGCPWALESLEAAARLADLDDERPTVRAQTGARRHHVAGSASAPTTLWLPARGSDASRMIRAFACSSRHWWPVPQRSCLY